MKTGSELANNCKKLYGEKKDLNNLTNLTELAFFFRVVLETFVREPSHASVEDRITKAVGTSADSEWLHASLPLCVRKKSPVIGKFPWTTWPKGTYGLPMAKTGCPRADRFRWNTGYYKQDTEDIHNKNNVTNNNNLAGRITEEYVKQSYCIKSSSVGSKGWPDGRYCIYKKHSCPPNMSLGEIFWDDEDSNNTNEAKGYLPDGMFKADTIIKFCCLKSPIIESGIVLPRDRPFYMFPFGIKKCQPVIGTKVHLENIQYDLEDDYGDVGGKVAFKGYHPYAEITPKGKHLVLYYCFYNPVPNCGFSSAAGHVEYPSSDFNVGRVINYTCQKGYHNTGDSKDICLESEMWSSVQGPHCQDIDECKSGHDCHVKANCHNNEGSYSCKCNPGWHGNGKNCKITKCPKPEDLSNGHYIGIKSPTYVYLPKTKIAVQCNHGYIMIGCNTTTCLQTGKWDVFPKCVDLSYCIKGTHHRDISQPGQNSLLSSCCSCSIRSDNVTVTTAPPKKNDETWTNTLITIVAALVGFIITVIVAMIALIRLREKDRNQEVRGTSIKNNSSIYADINEFHLDLKYDERKASATSNITASTKIKYAYVPPFIPPRPPVTESILCNSRKTSLFTPPDRLPFRRRSDFGSTDLFLVPPKQFSTIFDTEHKLGLHGRKSVSEGLDKPQTQFKLNSMSQAQRRHSEFAKYSPHPLAQRNNYIYPSPSIISRMADSTTPIIEAAQEDDEEDYANENPYIDMQYDLNDSDITDSEYSDCEKDEDLIIAQHYGQVPRNTLCSINVRNRSKTANTDTTGLETARQTYQKALYRDFHRSHSMPECLLRRRSNTCEINTSIDTTSKHDRSCIETSQKSTGSDDIFIQPDNSKNEEKTENSKSVPRKRRTGFQKISLKLKVTEFKKKANHKPTKRKISDLSSKISRYINRNDMRPRRNRSDTNPF